MRLGRLFFAGAILLGLAWFALRSPLPAADPRFLKADVADAGAPLAINLYLDAGYPRERANAELAGIAGHARQFAQDAPTDAGALSLARAERLEAIAAQLKAAGIGNLMVRYGGGLVVRGRRGGGPWRIGLRNPRGGPEDAVAYLLADRDEAIATFGEPRVVTVLGPDAVAATAAAQELLAAAEGWPAAARNKGLPLVMVIDAAGAVAVTAELSRRLKFLHGITPTVLP